MAEKRTHNEIGPAGRQVAENVRRLRSERDLTTADLAERVSKTGVVMSASTVTKVEKLNRRLTVDEFVALATALDVAPGALLLPPDADPTAVVAEFANRMLRPPFRLEINADSEGVTGWSYAGGARRVGSDDDGQG